MEDIRTFKRGNDSVSNSGQEAILAQRLVMDATKIGVIPENSSKSRREKMNQGVVTARQEDTRHTHKLKYDRIVIYTG
ncbi:hypothetical protein J6590_075346 [Homalodisca vitripennis]|nr:hypothetical protein J6590_075346 [Homalodisca vitripennis]